MLLEAGATSGLRADPGPGARLLVRELAELAGRADPGAGEIVNRFGHHGVAAAVALGVPLVLHHLGIAEIPPEQALAAAVAAQPFAAGRLSPDADHTWLSAFKHRRGAHGWWWPALAAWGLLQTPAGAVYAAWGPIIGWASHLFPADWVFGKRGRSIPKGIPVLPFMKWRTGLGLKVTGRDGEGHSVLELTASWVAWGLTLWLGWLTLSTVG